VVRHFRGARYSIHFRNPDGVEHGVKSITMDGKPVQGNLLPVLPDGRIHEVEVVLGG
jgi:cellobiose phosphorylase